MDDDPSDDNRHGTIEGGVAAAIPDNGVGVAGLAWGAKLMPLKVTNSTGRGDLVAIASAIEHAADNGAQVINMSLGTRSPVDSLQAAVEYAAEKGLVIVASGGNSDRNDPNYPAAYPEVIGVGGAKQDDSHPPFNRGKHIEVVAPGWDITTTDIDSGYTSEHGTSEAAPLVAGLAALLIAQDESRTAAEVRQRIIDTATDLGPSGYDETLRLGPHQPRRRGRSGLDTTAEPKAYTDSDGDRSRDCNADGEPDA